MRKYHTVQEWHKAPLSLHWHATDCELVGHMRAPFAVGDRQ